MAGTASDCRKKAKSWNGLIEGKQVDNAIVNPYNKVTGRHLKSKLVAWCAIFCVMALILGGLAKSKVYKSSGCKQQMLWFKKKKRWKGRGTKPQASWFVFFDFKKKKNGSPTHMGFITSVDYKKKGYCISIEGNKKLKNGKDGVGYRHFSYSASNKSIVGYGIPYYNKK